MPAPHDRRVGIISKLFDVFRPKKATRWPSGRPLNVRKPFDGKGPLPGEVRESGASLREADRDNRRDQTLVTVDEAEWTKLNSSNVDRIRYGTADKVLQVVFKNGALYAYYDVEPAVFLQFLRTHSPGQFVWYVLRAYRYRYRKLGEGFVVSPPRPERFDGMPFAVPQEIQNVQREAGRAEVDDVPVARGVRQPPLPAKFFMRT